jgi:hypothetical protein
MSEFPYVWAWSKYPCGEWGVPGNYKGKRCRVLARSTQMNSVALEFEDGYRTITSRNGLRRAKAGEATPALQLALLSPYSSSM